jgi:DNA polymerase elongation subunit (family B)
MMKMMYDGLTSWQVVYGDTDSLFVHLPECSLKQAFEVGQLIAKEVTQANPNPIKLQFEKAYMPCMLVTKKRYVGMRYETVTEVEAGTPHFEAKVGCLVILLVVCVHASLATLRFVVSYMFSCLKLLEL